MTHNDLGASLKPGIVTSLGMAPGEPVKSNENSSTRSTGIVLLSSSISHTVM